ncbi:hypothetical protein BT96DRAFT_932891 [Gymnopus androsaceus JB14]|uniref:Uncharacterized protein n=1 Tax=Gymnopus androsaceus JB14 TaxID=1447944 RepID=A0A6A4ICV2_9AGAR|nr:hypothetical protein BT96DRAFT_932891 [Gymnopus androsaceus JB14]
MASMALPRTHQSTHTILLNKKTQVQAILLLMVESGAILGVVQLSFIIIIQVLDLHAAPGSPTANVNAFLGVLHIFSAALNPVALVILIQTGSTYEHSFHLEDVHP